MQTAALEMKDDAHEHRRALMAKDLAAYYSELSAPRQKDRFSLGRMLDQMVNQKFRSGQSYEAEVSQAAHLSQGTQFDPQRAIVPWGALRAQRDLTASLSSAGGNLVGAAVGAAQDVLRPHWTAARLGVQVVEGLTSNLMVPSVSAEATGQWLANEASSLSTSDPVIGAISATPKTCGALIKASFLVVRQAEKSEQFLRSHMLNLVGNLLDRAIFQGTGAAGEPLGLLNAAGVGANSGAFQLASALAMESACGVANADDERLKFLSSPAVRATLKQRVHSGMATRYLWENSQIADRPAHATSNCPSATIFLGDWGTVEVALWGAGIEISLDPFTAFKTGAVAMRVLLSADVIFRRPAAFYRWTSFA